MVQPLRTYSISELQSLDLNPPKHLVENMLPAGVAILSGPPKSGKSWMCLELGLSVASGEPFLGKQTEKVGVLYMALEDSLYRALDRSEKLWGNQDLPKDFRIAIQSNRLDSGLLDQLKQEKEQRPELGLIIIDTFQKVRPARSGWVKSDYEIDYQVLGGAIEFIRQYDDMALLLIHHNRKARLDDSDPFDSINGSVALQGAVDTMWVLKSNRRKDSDIVLYTTGRDIIGEELVVDWNSEDFRWRIIGTQLEVKERRTWAEYEKHPIVITLKWKLDQLRRNGIDEYIARAKDFRNEVTNHTGKVINSSERGFQELVNSFDEMFYMDGIRHTIPEQSTKIKSADGRMVSGRFHRYSFFDGVASKDSDITDIESDNVGGV